MIENRNITHYDEKWRGYSLDELRYQRAVALARIEMEKEKMALEAAGLRQHVPGMNTRGLMGKIMGSLSYVDYIVLAFRLGRSLSKMIKGIRRQ